MSLVPFEKPRPEDELPDPFEGRGDGARTPLHPIGDGTPGETAGETANEVAVEGPEAPRLWAVPRPEESPGESGRRLPLPLEGDRVHEDARVVPPGRERSAGRRLRSNQRRADPVCERTSR